MNHESNDNIPLSSRPFNGQRCSFFTATSSIDIGINRTDVNCKHTSTPTTDGTNIITSGRYYENEVQGPVFSRSIQKEFISSKHNGCTR
jgi:hypothetical protein